MHLFLLAKAVCMSRQGITDNIVWMGSRPHCHEVLACCVFQVACDYIYFNTSDVTVLLASGSTPPCWPPDPLYPMLWKLPLCSHFDPVTPAPECHVAGMVLSPLPLPQHSHRTCCCSLLNWRSPHPPPPSFCHLLGSSLKNLFSDSIWHFWNLAFPGRVCQERVGTVLNQWLCLALATSIRCWIFRSHRRIYCHKPGPMTVMVMALRPPMSKTSPRQVSRQRKLPEQLLHTQ